MTSISDKVHPIHDDPTSHAYTDEGDAGSSVRVIAFEDPESTEQGGGGGVPATGDSREHGEGELHALMHEASVPPPKNPPPGDTIEDVEMLDGSVPTKLGVTVNINKLVGEESVNVPSVNIAAVQAVAGLLSQSHVPEILNKQPEFDDATTTYATTDGLIEVGTTEAPTTTTISDETIGTTQDVATTERADNGDSTDVESLSDVPVVESNSLLSRDDIPASQQLSSEATTLQTTYQPTTANPGASEEQPTTTPSHETTRILQDDAIDGQQATTEPNTTPSIPDQTEGIIQESTTLAPTVQSLSEKNADKITAVHEESSQNDEMIDTPLQSTKLPDVSESTSLVIPTTDVPERRFTIKPEKEAVTTKPVESYEDSVAEEDIIRPSDFLPERLANKTDADTEAGQEEKKEFTTSLPVTSTESPTATVVTERADVQQVDNGEAAEESSESQEESQETNEESHETNEQSVESNEQTGETTTKAGETGEQTEETVEQTGETSEQTGETVEQTGETSEQTSEQSVGQTDSGEQSTVRPVTVEISTQISEASSPSVSIEASSEASSPGEALLPAIVVKLLSAHSQISLRYARTLVETQLRNDAQRAQEARITIELPDDAFITGMTLESNGQVYRARVAERQAANQQYQEAVQHGQSAAQVVASGRNTNVFSVLVSVEPRQILGVNLTYEELLIRRRGRYRHTLTLRANQEIEQTEMEVLLVESRNLTALAVYAGERQLMSAEDRELALAGLSDQQAGLLQVKRQTWKSAVISLKAVGSQQQDLWGTQGAPHQIAVEYDVNRGAAVAGDLLLMDGYFVHFFAPPDLPPLRKHAILVLDTSGSMWGRKLRQVQQAMGRILDSLHPDDYFSIIQFASQVTEWSPHTLEVVGLREREATLPATKEHISKAKKFISSMEASGGTNIGGALRSALKLAARRDFDRWAGHGGSTGSPPQPLIIFLSDGLPTVGTLSANRILAATRAANGELHASIFSLSFGSRANWRFLQKISLQNHGFARRVYEAGDAAQQLHDFYREISSPLLTNVTFNYIVLKVNKTTVTKREFPLLCDGGEIVVAGRYLPGEENQLLEAEVEGWGGPEGSAAVEGAAPQKLLFRAQAQNISGLVAPPPPRTQAEPDPKTPGLLERLWAYLSIRQLLDRDLAEGADTLATNNTLAVDGPHGTGPTDETPRLRALYLALKYDFVTPLTSLVVVKPSSKPGGVVTETPTDPASDLDGVAESAVQAEDFPMQNKISEMNLAKPGPDLPISFKPLLLGEDQALNLDDIRWLSKHMDPLGRLLVNGTAYNLKVPTDEELSLVNKTAADQCPSIRSCQPLAKCVQAAFLDSYTIFADYFCALGRYNSAWAQLKKNRKKK